MADEPKSEYTDRELAGAKASIAKLTPESYLDQQRYIKNLEQNWPEAPASATVKVIYPSGYDILWTLRDFDEDMLAVRLDRVLVSFEDTGCKPDGFSRPAYPPAASTEASAHAQPRAMSPEDMIITTPDVSRDNLDKGGFDMFPVETITHMVTQGKGVPHLVVKGGNFTKFGWKAWQEVLPESLKLDDFPIGKEMAAPPSMRMAFLSKGDSEGKNRKVIAFLGEP